MSSSLQPTSRPAINTLLNGFHASHGPTPPVTAPPVLDVRNPFSRFSEAVLELEDGTAYKGRSFGAESKSVSGECVFQTGKFVVHALSGSSILSLLSRHLMLSQEWLAIQNP